MQTKLLTLALCAALAAACSSGDDTAGNDENSNEAGEGGGGRGGRGITGLVDELNDGGGGIGGGSSGAGGNMVPPDDGGDVPAGDGGDVPPIDGGDLPDPDSGVMPGDPPVVPDDPAVLGPWPVGVRTALIPIGNGQVPAEIWYPAELGSESGKSQEVYDFIKWLPPEAQDDVPAGDKPVPVICHCYRDLPLAAAHGPFPAVVFVHNFGAFRAESAGLMTHWASRGFVVVALDHPRLHLQDVLAYTSLGVCTSSGITEDTSLKRDLTALVAMLHAPKDNFAFLSGAIDADKMAVVGHADGADYASRAGGLPGVRLIVQINNSHDVAVSGDLAAVAYIGSAGDTSTLGRASALRTAFLDATVPALYAIVDNSGALSPTELCNAKSSMGRDGMEISTRYGLCDLTDVDYGIFSLGWDCKTTYLDQPTANKVFGFATVAALEQYLKGADRSAAWSRFDSDWGSVTVSSD